MTHGQQATIPREQQAQAFALASQGLTRQTPVNVSAAAGRHLWTLLADLGAPLSPADGDLPFQTAVRTLKDLITAYHEAGHLLAYHALTPRDRVQLDAVYFRQSGHAGVEAGLTYTRIRAPWWPDPTRNDEVVRELACILAGKIAEPVLEGGVGLSGSDQDDQDEAEELLEILSDDQREPAHRQALVLLSHLGLHPRLPRLAAHLYERWFRGDAVIPVSELEPFLTTLEATR